MTYNNCKRSKGYEHVDGDFELEQQRQRRARGDPVPHLDDDDLFLEHDPPAPEGDHRGYDDDDEERTLRNDSDRALDHERPPSRGGGLTAAYRSHRDNRVPTPPAPSPRDGDGDDDGDESVHSAHDHHTLDLEEEVTFDEHGNDLKNGHGSVDDGEEKSDLQKAFDRLEAELPTAES